MNDVDDILTPTSFWLKEKRRIALATVISTWGSSPRPVGGQMAIDENGEIIGSVSGGCIEGAVISEGIDSIKDGKSRIKDYGISNDMAWEVGLACGGELKVLIQPLNLEDEIVYSIVDSIKKRKTVKLKIDCSNGDRIIDNTINNQISYFDKLNNEFIHIIDPKPRLFIVGAVHIAQYLVDFAKSLNFEISIIDPRGYFASEQRFPDMKIINKWPDEAFKEIETNENTALIALTHDPKIDDPALQHALNKKFYYIGALGSKKTHENRCQRLKEAGFSDDQINSIHGPIGIKLGGKSAPEIALSIIAQLVSETYKK